MMILSILKTSPHQAMEQIKLEIQVSTKNKETIWQNLATSIYKKRAHLENIQLLKKIPFCSLSSIKNRNNQFN